MLLLVTWSLSIALHVLLAVGVIIIPALFSFIRDYSRIIPPSLVVVITSNHNCNG